MILILNSVVPIFAVIALGHLLRRFQFIDDTFIKVSDKLIYYIFFPALLFWKIGKPAGTATLETRLIFAVLCAVFIVSLASLIFVKLVRMPNYAVGSFSQGCFRFSTYIGMAVMLAALGEEGLRQLGVLIGFVIPFINVLAVSTLIWFSGESYAWPRKAVLLAKATLLNPLIVACMLGILDLEAEYPLSRLCGQHLGIGVPPCLAPRPGFYRGITYTGQTQGAPQIRCRGRHIQTGDPAGCRVLLLEALCGFGSAVQGCHDIFCPAHVPR